MAVDPYTPVSFTKDGVTEIASTRTEYVQYVFDGWTLGDVAPELPRSVLVAHLDDLDNLETELTALIGAGGGSTIIDNGDGTLSA